jgi:hypothetical protein
VKNRTGKTNFLPGIFWGADLFRSFEFPFPPYFPSRDLPYLMIGPGIFDPLRRLVSGKI